MGQLYRAPAVVPRGSLCQTSRDSLIFFAGNQSGSSVGAVHGDDNFVAGLREEVLEIGALLKDRLEIRDQLIGLGSGDQGEFHILNRTLQGMPRK